MIERLLTTEQRLRIWDNNNAYDRTEAQIRAGQYLKRKATTRGGRFILAYLLCLIGAVCFYFISK
jgi:hypothetical protein